MTFDRKLYESCLEGDRAAQEKLFKIYAPMMLGICLRYTKDKDEAEDVMQEAFIKIFTNITNFRGEGSFEGWMKRIVVNTSLNHYYKSKKTQTDKNFDDIRETEIVQEEEVELPSIRFTQDEMLNAIQELPEGYRQVFNMYVFEKYKHREIADLLNISVNTSKSQLSKARKYLQKILLRLENDKKQRKTKRYAGK
jgi:RNA polymerase sigma factor (sigma-70 family)